MLDFSGLFFFLSFVFAFFHFSYFYCCCCWNGGGNNIDDDDDDLLIYLLNEAVLLSTIKFLAIFSDTVFRFVPSHNNLPDIDNYSMTILRQVVFNFEFHILVLLKSE